MTTTNNINGVTLKDVTSMMLKVEKAISFYNKKYNFDISLGNKAEQKKYDSMIQNWDFLKSKRDILNS